MMLALIRGSYLQRGVRSLLRNAAKRLARKVVEHTASTGEHYLVNSRADWQALGLGAVGGGFITAFTALGKYAAGALPLAPLVLGFALAGNYAGSFILMQMCHFTLASKQPAMTAAALAANLEHGWHQEREVELVAAITRSQSIATLGNIAMAMPTAFLLDLLSQAITGHSLLSPETALHSVASLHPFLSLTIPFAALTGGFLWLASLGSGWAANWSAFRRLPEALARHRGLNRLVGSSRAAAIGHFTEEHFSGIVGYLILGFLLGFVPVLFARFFGIPIEVRHVTLSAASLALGAASLFSAGELHGGELAWGLLGIAVIGALNFGVSFSLALRTAMRARDLSAKERSALWQALVEAFRASPRRFLWKPAE
jgi:site-specific recombinase